MNIQSGHKWRRRPKKNKRRMTGTFFFPFFFEKIEALSFFFLEMKKKMAENLTGYWPRKAVCVCVCVCEREKEKNGTRKWR